MKKLFLLAAMVFSLLSAKAQILKRSTVDEIKQGRVIVALKDDEHLNEIWKAAIEKRWDYTEIIDYVPEDDAFDKLKADEVDYVLYLDTKVVARSRDYNRGGFTYSYRNEGMAIALRTGKRANAAIQFIPPFGDDNEYTEAFINFGLDAFQYQFEIITSKELKSNTNLYAKFNENGNELKEKTLLVLAEWIHKKISIEEVKEIYEGKIEAVPFADWKEAIMEKQEGKAYVVVVPIPLGRSYVYYHYLMDAATGRILGMGQPKVSFGVNIGAYNYSKNNSGFVNEKNLEIYNELMD